MLLWAASINAWGQAALTGPRFEAESLRVSSFLDGHLVSDEKAMVAHAQATAHTLAQTRIRISVPVPFVDSAWQVGAFTDSQAWVMGDSVRALAFFNNQQVASQNASYGFDVQSQSIRRTGVTLATSWEMALPQAFALQLATQVKYFSVDEFKASHVRGSLTETVAGAVGLQAQTVEQHLGGQSLFVKPERVLGYGLALDAALKLVNGRGSHVTLAVEDLGPAITLPSVLRTSQNANTQTVSYDTNGYIHFAPLLTGQYAIERLQVVFAPTWSTAWVWQLRPGLHVLASAQTTQTVQQVSAGLTMSAMGQLFTGKIHGGKELPASLELAWTSKHIALAWRADALSPHQARVWGVAASLHY